MFDGFERKRMDTSGATIDLVVGGSGPPLLLLHGYPQSHVMWHRIAPRLAGDFTVVAPTLRGYGDSSKPEGGPDHAAYSKRAMGQDQVEVMQALGFERFGVAGHDRGARVAYRLALDRPEVVTKLAVLDIVPTYTLYASLNRLIATAYYHWFLLVQPFDLPERLIGADPAYFLRTCLDRWSGSGIGAFDEAAVAEYARCFSDPATVHATCEDYRAGATLDFAADEKDFGRRKIACPTLALYGRGLARLGALEVWRQWCDDVRGQEIDCGHFLPEEAPDPTYDAVRDFFAG
jgi:haloacetate dehalogenase